MDRFRPNLPLDPFEAMDPHFGRAAWLLDPEPLQPTSSKPRDVILVVGQPGQAVLHPLLTSQHLAHSLVILATGPGAPIVQLVPLDAIHCTLRVIRLDGPLAVHDGGGATFLQVLERAERIAKRWRAGLDKGPQLGELKLVDDQRTAAPAQNGHGRSSSRSRFSLKQRDSETSLRGSWMTPPSLHTASPGNSPRNSLVGSESGSPSLAASPNTSSTSLPSSATTVKGNGTTRSMRQSIMGPDVVPCRPFDALLNILPFPEHTGPKVMLKQAIMVTTLARPFLVQPPVAVPSPGRQPNAARPRAGSNPSSDGRRWSSLNPDRTNPSQSPASAPSSRPVSTSIAPGRDKPRLSHLIHIVPRFAHSGDHAALVRALEAFILNFADSHGLRAAPLPVVVDDSALGGAVQIPQQAAAPSDPASVLECILSGALDLGASRSHALERRAWLAGAGDIEDAATADARMAGLPAVVVQQPQPRPYPIHAATTPVAATKGKQRATLRVPNEAGLPSPPPSPPFGAPAVMLTPPSAAEGSTPFSSASPSPSSDTHPSAPHQSLTPHSSHPSRTPSSSEAGWLGSRSEPVLHGDPRSTASTTSKKTRWWWPFKSGGGSKLPRRTTPLTEKA